MLITCPECGTEIDNPTDHCPKCGYPFTSSEKLSPNKMAILQAAEESKKESKDLNRIKQLEDLKKKLIILSVLCFCISGFFFYRSFNVKNEYKNTDYSILNKNAYVGGDAYNYIINGTYFTGYSIIASSVLLSGVIIFNSTIGITIKIKELKWEE